MESLKRVKLLNACSEPLNKKEVAEDRMVNKIKVLKEEYKMEKLKQIRRENIRYLQKSITWVFLEVAQI